MSVSSSNTQHDQNSGLRNNRICRDALSFSTLIFFSISAALAEPITDPSQTSTSFSGESSKSTGRSKESAQTPPEQQTQQQQQSTTTPDPDKSAGLYGGELEDADRLKWPQAIDKGPDLFFYFTEAISGKPLKPASYELLKGVTEVCLRDDKIIFKRIDNKELEMGADTAHGAEVKSDWDKAKKKAGKQFGPNGQTFLESIKTIKLNGDRVELIRSGAEEISIVMGERKLHHAFDLRGLRFGKVSFLIDTSQKHPFLKDIDGVSVLINAPGFSFPVEVKEFHKWKNEKGTDLKVGVKNPVPGALRTVLFMPPVIRFHFSMPKKD